jgi:ElaB/YqjD/DUF883 family membrane-anchored ribosome-binding protein
MWNRISEHEPSSWSVMPRTLKKLPSLAANKSRDWIDATESLVRENPGAAIMVAFLAGATLAWWLKRR